MINNITNSVNNNTIHLFEENTKSNTITQLNAEPVKKTRKRATNNLL